MGSLKKKISDPILMTATRAAAGVIAEGGDTHGVKVLITDPGEGAERNSCFASFL